MAILCAIPCYNGEFSIASVALRAAQHADEVLVIDDGSADRTSEVARLAGAQVIRHDVNKGYGGALRTIFQHAKKRPDVEALVILDSDGQHDPKDIPAVLAPILEGLADVSIGSRFVEETSKSDIPTYRQFGIRVLTRMTNVGAAEGDRVADAQSGFRAYSRKAIDLIDPVEADMGASAEILFQARRGGLIFTETPIHVRYDVEGSSQNPVRHALGVIGSMVRFLEAERPILFFGIPGLAVLIAGLLLGGWSLTIYFRSGFLPFGPTVGSAFAILIGLLLGFTGLILHAVLLAARRAR